MIVNYYEATTGGKSKRHTCAWPKVCVAVGSPGGTVTLEMRRVDSKEPPCRTEMTIEQARGLVAGILDALSGFCGMTPEQRRNLERKGKR